MDTSARGSAVILSDGRPGHYNQSIALCNSLGFSYRVAHVRFVSPFGRLLSYLFDALRVYRPWIFSSEPLPESPCACVVSTGSRTYYPNKVLSRWLGIPSVAVLCPRGYRLDFDCVVAPAYDNPPVRENVVTVPVSLCNSDPASYDRASAEFRERYQPSGPGVGVIIGGDNAVSHLDPAVLWRYIEQIFALTPDHEHWVTTSPRTSVAVEAVVDAFPFDFKLIYSRDTYNPTPAFIALCDRLFVTSDSASMISECVSFGRAAVDILMNEPKRKSSKFTEFISELVARDAVHVFDGTLGRADKKIGLAVELENVRRCISHKSSPR